jgi:hypothetical protein
VNWSRGVDERPQHFVQDDGALSDLSDEELDAFILGDDEVQLKSKIWHEVNSEYLEKQAAKAAQIAEDEALGIVKVRTVTLPMMLTGVFNADLHRSFYLSLSPVFPTDVLISLTID